MKIIELPIMSFQKDQFYTPIRDKVHYAKILLKAAQLLLMKNELVTSDCDCSMKLIVDRMSRLFFYTPGKFYSVSFPFLIRIEEDGAIKMKTFRGVEVDSQSISASLSVLMDKDFSDHPSTADYCLMTDGKNLFGINMLEEILLAEPSYIRYDNDPENQKGKLHPLDHFDINYSSYGTYKVGLEKAIQVEYFEDVLNINTDCSFLDKEG